MFEIGCRSNAILVRGENEGGRYEESQSDTKRMKSWVEWQVGFVRSGKADRTGKYGMDESVL